MKRVVVRIGVALFILGLLAVAGYLALPKVGNWYVRTRILPRLEARLGRSITVRRIAVTWHDVELDGIVVAGAKPDDPPLAEIASVTATYNPWRVVRGGVMADVVTIDKPVAALSVTADGRDNFTEVLKNWQAHGSAESSTGPRPPRFGALHVQRGALTFDDAHRGVTMLVADISGDAAGEGPATLVLANVELTTRLGPHASADKLTVHTRLPAWRKDLALDIEGGKVVPWRDLALTGIHGTIAPEGGAAAGRSARVKVDIAGGYGGAADELWRAEGWLDPHGTAGQVTLHADRFSLAKLAPVLAGTPILKPEKTSMDASLDLAFSGDDITFSGGVHIAGLTLYHHLVADEPVPDISIAGSVKGKIDRRARTIDLESAEVDFRGVKAQLEAHAALAGGVDAAPGAAPPQDGQAVALRTKNRVRAHLVIPPVPCQTALLALPPEVTPKLQGFSLIGTFATDLTIDIDWANLDALVLEGKVGIDGCKVRRAPSEMDAKHLEQEFDHRVQVTKDKWLEFAIGPSNPDFVPIAEISPNLRNSIMTSEDSSFYKHHGFITSEFRSALIKNLKAGKFVVGASSITMQFVKNVLLGREKTLSRKLQELFLTWYIEQSLPKDRIFEIYLNAIEYGPGIYGIGVAAKHYFGKPASELNPVEAAFFSSILPNPKWRHYQYCDGELSKYTRAKVPAILKHMFERDRLSQVEYLGALATPLTFAYPDGFDAKKCHRDTKKIIDEAPSMTPEPADIVIDDDTPTP